MFRFQQKNYEKNNFFLPLLQKTGKYDPYTEGKKKEKKSNKNTLFKEAQVEDVADRDFKTIVVSMLKELKVA